MDKAELGRLTLLELLGDVGARPVDEVIRALAYRRAGEKPHSDLATVIARPDEFKDHLLAEVALTPADVAVRGEAAPDDRHAYFLHTFALYLLALWEEPRAYVPIVAYLSADPELADAQLEDIETEDLPAILARTYDGGDLGPLKSIIENTGAPPFLRGAGLCGLHGMARLGKLDRNEVVAYFEALAGSLDPAANEDFMDVFAMDMAALQEERLRPIIDRWFAEKLIDTTLLSPSEIDATYGAEYDEVNEELVRRERFDALIDYLCDWAWFNESDPRALQLDDRDDLMSDFEDNWPAEPYVRAARKIGRNEPCPCGSGKKYKKCCLGADGG